MKIVYMGTPDFAVAPLRALVEGGYQVVSVVTMPDKPAGRGMKLQFSPVKQYALEQGLPILQPEKLKDESFLQDLRSFKADLQIVVAFRMLPEVVWSMPSQGTFNLHASLLPQYRGAAPIHWAVMNGETETGVTTFFLQHEIDTGDMILQERLSIGADENTGSVHDRLMILGAKVVCCTVDRILSGEVIPEPQPEGVLKSAPKLFRENTRIDWNKTPGEIHNFIRGLSPFPVAWTEMLDKNGVATSLKVYEASAETAVHSLEPGLVIVEGKTVLKVVVPGGYVLLKRVQQAGRKVLNSDEFLRGIPGNGICKLV